MYSLLSLTMRFSQRIGLRPVKTLLQVGSIDEPLMNRLWNVFLENFYDQLSDVSISGKETFKGNICKHIWKEFFGNRVDQIPKYASGGVYSQGVVQYIEKWIFYKAQWDEVYDFVEFIAQLEQQGSGTNFINNINEALEKEVSGYRLINGCIAEITSEIEIDTIQEALDATTSLKTVSLHLITALEFLSNKQNPDYRNSIKESISAVEALCKIIAEDENATMGKALAIIEKKHSLHPTLKEAYNKIYGYTSDANGIRHALLEDDLPIEFEDAKFMLVSCSAFINYLRTKLKL